MATTLLNPTLWLLAGLAAAAAWAGSRGAPASLAIAAFERVATHRAVLVVLAALALGAISTRLVLGFLSPGAYAEEVVQARALLADNRPGTSDARAELAAWLREEPPATDPWLLPGLTPCQAGAMRERPRFFSGQAHTPALVLASVPVVRAAGGRGLFVVLAITLLAALGWIWRRLVVSAGWTLRDPRAWLLAVALAGWQPVLAALRQGDAVLVAAALLVAAWAAARRERWRVAGVCGGLAGVVALPALVTIAAFARRPRALAAALVTVAAAALAVAATGGPLLLVDFARNVAFTTRTYAEMPVNYSVAGRMLALAPAWSVALGGALAACATVVRVRRADGALAALCPLACLAAPVAWSQHLALLLVPAVALSAATRGSARALGAWALGLAAVSMSDPAVAWLSERAWPGDAPWPIVPILLAAAWLALVLAPARTREPAP